MSHRHIRPPVIYNRSVSFREFMEEALRNDKVCRPKEQESNDPLRFEVLNGWVAAAALALRYSYLTPEGKLDEYPEGKLDEFLDIISHRLVDPKEVHIDLLEVPVEEALDNPRAEIPKRQRKPVEWLRTGADGVPKAIYIDFNAPWCQNISYLGNSRFFEEWNISHDPKHPHTLIIPSSPIFFTNRIRASKRIDRGRQAINLHKIFIQMVIYWFMVKHARDTKGRLLSSVYLYTTKGWVDMIESHPEDYELGYESFDLIHKWLEVTWRNDSWRRWIDDAVSYWIKEGAGLTAAAVQEQREVLLRYSWAMIKDLLNLYRAVAKALPKYEKPQPAHSLSRRRSPAPDHRDNVFFPSAR